MPLYTYISFDMMRVLLFCLLLTGVFRTGYAQSCAAPRADDVTTCSGTAATLRASGDAGEYRWYDAVSGGQLLFTGSDFTTPLLSASTSYYVEVIRNNCVSSRTQVTANVRSNPVASGATTCASSSVTLRADGPGGIYEWFDASSGGNLLQRGPAYTTPVLTATTTYYVQTTVDGCTSFRTPVTVTVLAKPAPPVVSDIAICSGSAVTLTATGPGGMYQWFSTSAGGSPLIVSPDFTTPTLTATTRYYVQTTVNGCVSERKEVIVTIRPLPQGPLVNDIRICAGLTGTLTAGGAAGTYTWFAVPSRGNPLGTGNTFTSPVLNRSTTYYVQSTINGCSSVRTPVTVIVDQIPDPPIAAGKIVCKGSGTILTASGSNGSYSWYDLPAGGNLLSTNASFSSPILTASTTYYVQSTLNGCTGPRTEVQVTVVQPPSTPLVSDTTVCAGNSVTLVAAGSGGVYSWYDAPSGGNLLLINQQYTPPPLNATTTFYVQAAIGDCSSKRIPVTVNIIPRPPAPAASGLTICSGNSANLTATGGGAYEWYDAAAGGTLLKTGSDFTSPVLSSTTTYFVQTTLAGCTSARTPVTVSINSPINPGFRYSTATFCKPSPVNPRPVLFIPSGGTFSSAPAGLVFISTSTGQVDVNASALGTYSITFVSNGPCPISSAATLTITDNLISQFRFEGPYCQDGNNPGATYPTGGSQGVFSASPGGLVFTGDGAINLGASLPGNYIITNTIPANGSCAATSSRDTVVILPASFADAGADQSVLAGSPVSLSGRITNTGSFLWSGGAGSFSDPAILNPIYTPGSAEGRTTLYLTASGTSPCNNMTDSVVINFNVPAPVVQDTDICSGSTSTLTASGPVGVFQWYDAPVGGNLLLTNPTFVSPPLTRNTTYYVQATVGGAISPRIAARVIVNPVPSVPTASGTTICERTSATLTASGSTGTYQWYDDPVSGTLLASAAMFTTPNLNATTTYYVQSALGNCSSTRTAVTVNVNPVPLITSPALETICNGTPLNYIIRADLPGTMFTWSRASVANVNNAEVLNQTSSVITETLITSSISPVDVTYVITPVLNGCAGPSFNYVVTVDPTPLVTSASTTAICNNSATNYEVKFNIPGTIFTWSRAAVQGVSNAAVSGQGSEVIREVLTNTTNAPVRLVYTIDYSFEGCPGIPFDYTVTLNPIPEITSPSGAVTCNKIAHNYTITSSVTGTTYTWSRPALANITNAALADQSSPVINETLVNTGATPVDVLYTIIPRANGCTGSPFTYRITVNPTPATPVILTGSPVCVESDISLRTNQVSGAAYLWSGPNGFSSAERNVVLNRVSKLNEGIYSLVISVNGCISETSAKEILVNELPVSNAGTDQTVCISSTQVFLSGRITGGTSTGIWSSNGTGEFSPSNTALNAIYLPSPEDRNSGSRRLTLTSTSADDCIPSSSSIVVTFEQLPLVQAGPDQDVCSQAPDVTLNGNISVVEQGVWTSSGTGTFSPSNTVLNAVYIPGNADIIKGSVILSLSAVGNNVCLPVKDELTVRIIPPPIVKAGPDQLLPINRTLTLKPEVNDDNVQYLWTPNINLSDNTIKNPVLTGVTDQIYTLRVTDSRGCVTEDEIFIDVLMPIQVLSAFTPNGDGVNDVWNIPELSTYPENTVYVYNRYGKKIFTSAGYGVPWDGTDNGEPAPVGTYYYAINTKFPGLSYAGYVTILR